MNVEVKKNKIEEKEGCGEGQQMDGRELKGKKSKRKEVGGEQRWERMEG